jgi:hypothetical protein
MVYSLYIKARAAFTTYLLTTCFWVVSRKVVKKKQLSLPPWLARDWNPTENCFLIP